MRRKNGVKVAVIMGSQSDWPVMKEAVDFLREIGVAVDAHILSAHRTPDRMAEFAKAAESHGYGVIIAGAGGAAHLPGMTAAYTTVPVIGVPVPTKNLQGLDSLLSIVQMPGGIPVATVAIGQAKNAAILAAEILAVHDGNLRERLHQVRRRMAQDVMNAENALNSQDDGDQGADKS
ncbi:5-(carboxyamino)imidazole ribonucleotide mutase [Sulfobacillus thermosulfidooxidans]|uniref:5-(carboxyamino)imidazole ribonucleotide mutase n=1 Tax=Sulfobacillus thermosulfidooxidans TaxID=28034 RepID=UPI0006B53CE2|nr:5-(carboxyamino)imidazole ribonucleotide mutase [Sulfobacillus thermosulfidooxidans]